MALPATNFKTSNSKLKAITKIWNLEFGIWNFKKGFTLIELLVVISIIGILAALTAASYTKVQQKARDSKRKSDVKSIQQALELYFQNNGHYPPWDGSNEQVGWCTIIDTSNVTWQADVYGKLTPTFINPMPKDPVYAGIPGDYFYKKLAVGQYQMGAVLENSNDPDINTTFNFATNWGSCAGYSSLYNYLATNP